jgi:cytochrome c553
MNKTLILALSALTIVLSGAPNTQAAAVTALQTTYQAAGAKDFSAARGKTAWTQEASVDGKPMSCSSCHGTDLTQAGKHIKTQKTIAAMAPSVNPKRLNDAKKIEKWLLRNCKGTWGRECTPQEKGDFLAYLGSL